MTAFIDSNGNRESFHYEQNFWKYTTFVTAGGTQYEHDLDRAGRRVSTKDSDGISSYAYNNFDILCMETDPLGNTTKYIYDRVLDLTGMVQPKHFNPASNDEKRETYTYDALHNRLSRTDAIGAVFATIRDGEGNIVKEINPNAYDLHGNIIKMISAKGMETGASDEERIGELYAYNYIGWLMERRMPMQEEDGEVRYQLT